MVYSAIKRSYCPWPPQFYPLFLPLFLVFPFFLFPPTPPPLPFIHHFFLPLLILSSPPPLCPEILTSEDDVTLRLVLNIRTIGRPGCRKLLLSDKRKILCIFIIIILYIYKYNNINDRLFRFFSSYVKLVVEMQAASLKAIFSRDNSSVSPGLKDYQARVSKQNWKNRKRQDLQLRITTCHQCTRVILNWPITLALGRKSVKNEGLIAIFLECCLTTGRDKINFYRV